MKVIHICNFSEKAKRFKDNNNNRWYVEWHGFLGPVFSRDDFQDGGVSMEDVPNEILARAQVWLAKVLNSDIRLLPWPSDDY